MLDQDIKQQLTAYLERVQQPFEMVATLGTDAKSDELRELLEEVASIRADKISLRTDGSDARVPSF
ncbi:MAG TPA: alkyl hydroperoxide reductase subunit F, partial [Ottowia sp.]|nr:alkyl hydroperoxide reductase subunit F [Ottowia sp.]